VTIKVGLWKVDEYILLFYARDIQSFSLKELQFQIVISWWHYEDLFIPFILRRCIIFIWLRFKS